ncbi:MAG: hypothetical protein ABSF34_14810 [Verrucomicrobiota bacterium]|jgi:hypothetical protein
MGRDKNRNNSQLSKEVRESRKAIKDINRAYKDICCRIEKVPNYLLPGLLIFVATLSEERKVLRKDGIRRI